MAMTNEDFESALARIRGGQTAVPGEEQFMNAVRTAAGAGDNTRRIQDQGIIERTGKSFAGYGDIAALNLKRRLSALGLPDITPEEEARMASEQEYIKQAGWPGIIGSGGAQAMIETPAAMYGGPNVAMGALGRAVGAGGLSSLFSRPGKESEAGVSGIIGQLGGETIGKGISATIPYVKSGYQGLKALFHAPTGAAQKLEDFARSTGEMLPYKADLSRTYENIPELKPTLGMMVPEEQKSLIDLENILRVGPGRRALSEADVYNQQAILKGLQERAFDPARVTEEMEALNQATGGLRQAAYETARQKPSRELAEPIMQEISGIRTRPGEMGVGSPEAQTIASEVEKRAFGGPVGQKTVIGSAGLPVEIPEFARKVDPANLYAARKKIDDVLRGATGDNSDLSNAIKSSKVTAIELKKAIDEALTNASEGKWNEYLQTYIDKIKPIEEGKAFQGVLNLFQTAPRVPGSDLASITPFGMRKAAAKATYKELGTSLADMLSPEGRAYMNEAASAMSAMENVRKGVRAVEGSQTTPYREAISRQVTSMFPRVAGAAMQGIGVEAKNKAEQMLVNAIRNPEQFQELLDIYHGMSRPAASERVGLQRLFGTAGAATATRY